MFAALLCALALAEMAGPRAEQLAPPQPAPLSVLGPLPAGESALTIEAGAPFFSVHLDHGLPGLGSRVDAGLGLDLSPAGFLRPQARARVRILALGATQLTVRGVLAVAVPDSRAGYGPREIKRTEDGELSLGYAWAVVPQLALFAEAAVLGQTDFTAEHSASQMRGVLGLALGPLGPFALICQGGILRGRRGHAKVVSGGVVFRF